MKKLLILSLPFIILGCASTPENMSVAKADVEVKEQKVNKKVKCSTSRATGSQMKKKRCWDKKEYEQMQEESRETLRRAIDQGGTRPPVN